MNLSSTARTVAVSALDLQVSQVNGSQAGVESIRENDLLEFECTAFNSKPHANISWLLNGELLESPLGSATVSPSTPTSGKQAPSVARHKRLLQRTQIRQNSNAQTFNSHAFLTLKVSRHENKAHVACQAVNSAMQRPIEKSVELKVQCKCVDSRDATKQLPVSQLTHLSICSNQTHQLCSWNPQTGFQSTKARAATQQFTAFTAQIRRTCNRTRFAGSKTDAQLT